MKSVRSVLPAIFLCSFFNPTTQQSSLKPLVFEFGKEDGQRVKIYWDPAVDVKKIKEVASRDVHYVINNVTGKVREEYSPWQILVTELDEVDPVRLLFVKSDPCVEQDYRLSWYDSSGNLHENATQRMEPSPEPWKPTAKVEVTNLRYDGATKHIVGDLNWGVSDEKLRGIPKLGLLQPAIDLTSCRTLFDKPIPPPVLDQATKLVSFNPLYAKHNCVFSIRLRQMTYNSELECRSLRQTTSDNSDRVELNCIQGSPTNYPDCDTGDSDQPCSMTCDHQVTATGEYDWSRGWPKPLVSIQWKPRVDSTRQIVNHVIRFAQVDSVLNNYPIEEFNVTFTETPANQTRIQLEPFSTDPESLYTFQVCAMYEACFATAKWSSVPKHGIYATAIVNHLPPQTTTIGPNSANGTVAPRIDNSIKRKQRRSE